MTLESAPAAAAAGAVGAHRPLALRLEAAFWLTRVGTVWAAMLAPAGWFAATGAEDFGGLALAMLAMACAGGIVGILNDVFDREKDRVTAPFLPIPAGLLTLPEALAAALALVGLFVIALGLASVSLAAYATALAAAAGAGLLVAAYSPAKRFTFAPMLLAATVYADIPFVVWCAAGGGGLQPLAEVLAYSVFFGLGTNTYTGMQDMDTDPEVGNSSLASSYGAARSYLLAAAFDLAAILCILLASLQIGRAEVGVPVALVCLVAIVGSQLLHRAAGGWSGEVVRARWARSAQTVTFTRVITQVGMIAVFSIPAAAVITGVLGALLVLLGRGYHRRIVLGGLRRQMTAAGA